MQTLSVIEKVKKDCDEKGHGRKKWWADNLGIHQQSLSYWLNGHRRPNGVRHEQINKILAILNVESPQWKEHLLTLFFNKIEVETAVLKEIIKSIISAESIDSRTLSFLSFIVQNSEINDFSDSTLLRNRLGWLLEVSDKKANFKPLRSRTMPLVKMPGDFSNPKVVDYLKSIQTNLGKRWQLYDCDIEPIKESFLCRPPMNKSSSSSKH